MPLPPSDYRQLAAETAEALADLRHLLRAVLDSILPEGYGARSLGRSLGIEQTTAWRCWRLARVADPAQALQAMPGRRAWEDVFLRFERHGVAAAELASLRKALARIEPLVFGRRANRTALRSMAAGGLDSAGDLQALRELRRATSRGNARLYGLQAGAIVLSWLIAPGARAGTVSLGVAGGMSGLRRFRPGVSWPLLQRSAVFDPRMKRQIHFTALGDAAGLPTVIAGASTPKVAAAELRSGVRHGQETIEFADVAADRNGLVHFCHAEWLPDAGGLDAGEVGPVALATPVLVPAESIAFELRLHRAVARHTDPTVALFGTPVPIEQAGTVNEASRLPLEIEMKPIRSAGPPAREESFAAGLAQALRRVAKAQGSRIEEYEVHRVVLPHPPLFASIAGEFELIGRA